MDKNKRKLIYPRGTGVYVIHASELAMVKIGHSGDLDRRFKAIECSNPSTLTLIWWHSFGDFDDGVWRHAPKLMEAQASARKLEVEMHALFKGLRVKGEWYRYSGAIAERFPIKAVA